MAKHEHVIVTTGDDQLTKPMLDYLNRTYGIPARDIKALNLDSEVGQVQILTVTLMVRNEAGGMSLVTEDNPGIAPLATGGIISKHDRAVFVEDGPAPFIRPRNPNRDGGPDAL